VLTLAVRTSNKHSFFKGLTGTWTYNKQH